MITAETDTPFGPLRLSAAGTASIGWEEIAPATLSHAANGARLGRLSVDLTTGRDLAMTLELVANPDCTVAPAFAQGMEVLTIRNGASAGVFGMGDGLRIEGQGPVNLTDFAADNTSISYVFAARGTTTMTIPAAIAWTTIPDHDGQAMLAVLDEILAL